MGIFIAHILVFASLNYLQNYGTMNYTFISYLFYVGKSNKLL